MVMTKEQLAEIRGRVKSATDGPWEQNQANVTVKEHTLFFTYMAKHKDAEFIAHARQDVPELIDEVERLQYQLQEVREALNLYIDDIAPTLRNRAEIAEKLAIDLSREKEELRGRLRKAYTN